MLLDFFLTIKFMYFVEFYELQYHIHKAQLISQLIQI